MRSLPQTSGGTTHEKSKVPTLVVAAIAAWMWRYAEELLKKDIKHLQRINGRLQLVLIFGKTKSFKQKKNQQAANQNAFNQKQSLTSVSHPPGVGRSCLCTRPWQQQVTNPKITPIHRFMDTIIYVKSRTSNFSFLITDCPVSFEGLLCASPRTFSIWSALLNVFFPPMHDPPMQWRVV